MFQHIDAALHLLRRRKHFFQDMYASKTCVLSTPFSQMVVGRWKSRDSDKVYIWSDEIMMFVVGDPDQFLESWGGKEFICFVLCIEERNHWVAVVVSVMEWEMQVYDCDITVTSDDVLNGIMTPFTEIIPSLMKQSGLFDWCRELEGEQPQPMSFRRLPPDVVPQTKSR